MNGGETMLITRENDYALRMIRALADKEIKIAKKICDDENIPQNWGYKILKKMERAKMIKAFHGSGGGYQLVKDVSEITMLDILTIDKDTLRFYKYIPDTDNKSSNMKAGKCPIQKEFVQIENSIEKSLQERTVESIFSLSNT